jgi:serine/threonine-protein kinase
MIQIGKEISHYRVLEKLGGGGMGVVYKAEDIKLDRFVALKFLPHHFSLDEEAKERFILEAKATSGLDHPNICNIHEIDEIEDGQLFICMAYYDGETLKRKIERGPLEIEEAVDIIHQVTQGLAKAHSQGILHRDIKPANIMITADGVVKIVDFGLAKLAGQAKLTKTGTTLGTIAYMSPEQLKCEEVDERADIWSLGVVFYEMITGNSPFEGGHELGVIYSIMNDQPKAISEFRQDVPIEVERIICKSMERDPSNRYQKTCEIMVDLVPLRIQGETEKLTNIINEASPAPKNKIFMYGSIASVAIVVIVLFFLLLKYFSPSISSRSIAVLPFKNISGEMENEYFCEGITEDVIAHLSKLEKLKVISRTSSMQYKNSDKSIRHISEELNVANILEGSVRRSGNNVRVVAQLIDATNDEHLWAETYDKELTQIFAIQSDVASNIAKALKTELSPEEIERLDERVTENLESYDLYLKGRYNLTKREPDSLKNSIKYFEKALEIDPKFALAHAGLADAYILLGNLDLLPPNETFPNAKRAAAEAIKIDPMLGEAHTSMAFALFYFEWNWAGAEKEFLRGIELNPGNANAYSWYAIFLTSMGRFKEAKKPRTQALLLDPLSAVIGADIGLQYFFEKKYEETFRQCQKVLEMDPLMHPAYIGIAGVYLKRSMYEEAIATLSNASLYSKGHPTLTAVYGYAYAVAGRTDDAEMVLELLEERSEEEYVSSFWMAVINLGLGDNEKAFQWLERAYQEKDDMMVFLKVIPIFEPIQQDKRYNALLAKMNLGGDYL